MLFDYQPLFLFGALSVFSFALTFLVRMVSHRVGFVSRPTADRWSQRTVALGGGIAIQLTVIAGFLWIQGPELVTLLPAFAGIFILGVIDDIYGVPATTKLIFQAAAASWAVGHGFLLPLHSQVASIALTIVWIVGVSNAVNLIDNMDGLAAGTTVIAATGFAYLLSAHHASPTFVLVAVSVAAASFGFLIHNFPPAKIFMGDAGSLPTGFLLAVVSTQLTFDDPQMAEFFPLVPICLALIVPLFDTGLVMVARHNANKPLMSGGKDHTSHRLVKLGLKEKSSVLVLYLMGIIGTLSATLIMKSSIGEMISFSVAAIISLILLGVFFLEVSVYPPSEFKKKKPGTLPPAILYALEITIDICLISATWTLAHSIRFYESGYQVHHMLSLVPTLPYLISIKLISCSLFKMYRGLWRTISGHDVYKIFKAATLGSLLLVLGLALKNNLQDTSRIVLILDWCLTFLALLGSRAAYSAFRRWTGKLARQPNRVALLGDPALVEMVKKTMSYEKGIEFSGVITPEPGPSGQNILGSAEKLETILNDNDIDTLLVATDKFDDAVSQVSNKGITLRRVNLRFT